MNNQSRQFKRKNNREQEKEIKKFKSGQVPQNLKIEKRNAYICKQCRKVTLLVHVDLGVTPMFIPCTSHGCNGVAISFMYRLPPPLLVSLNNELLPSHEWYKPSEIEFNMLDKSQQDHVKNGGLLIRERTKAEAIMQMLNPQPKF